MVQTKKCIVMMTKEGSNKIVNFISPGAGYLCPYKLYSEIKSALFLSKSSSLFWGMIQTN